MLKTVKHIILVLTALCWSGLLAAQERVDPADVEMADAMRANGKIYVVVAVLAAIFVGIAAYLVVLDIRLRKLEKQQQQ